MEMGQRVKTIDGSLGVIIAIHGGAARVCYLAPNYQLSYITDTFLLQFLTAVPESKSGLHTLQ